MKDKKEKKSKIRKLKLKSKYHFLKLYADMQRVYLLDIAKNHRCSDEHLNKLELRLEELQEIIAGE
jgi:hypothetical protein